MNKALIAGIGLLSLIGISAAMDGPDDNGERGMGHIVSFGTMYGVDGPFIGEENAIRRIPGDELPWVVDRAKGFLDESGRLKIKVQGLVFADDPSVPPELVGKNDEKEFRAVVSCLTEDENDQVSTVNVTTDGFPADEDGNCDINALVELPDPCVAPIVFVIAGSEDKWFAVTGVEMERDR